jgi:ribose transport system substrate-binding protein
MTFERSVFVVSFSALKRLVNWRLGPFADSGLWLKEETMRCTSKVLSALASCITSLTVSCGPAAHQNERYVFVATNINIPYWQQVKSGFMDSGHQLSGSKVEFKGPDRYAPNDELQTFRDAVDSHPDGILVSPAQPDLFKTAIDSAIDAGIPVITVDSDSPHSRRALFLGTDNYRAGFESGNTMASILNGHGGLVVIKIAGQDNQEERARGLRDALKKYPSMIVGAEVNDSGDSQVAGDAVAGMLQNGGHPSGIICLEASCGPGVAKAFDKLGMAGKIPILAMDANPETLTLIGQGYINATIAQKPYTMGYYGLQFLDDLHHNRVHEFPDWRTAPASPLPAMVDTGTVVVNPGNLQKYLTATALPKS